MRPPTTASVAGSSVTAAAMDSSTTERPAMPNEVSSGTPNTNSPDMATATVRAEKTTVVPAEVTVATTASWTSRPWPRSSRNRLTMSRP